MNRFSLPTVEEKAVTYLFKFQVLVINDDMTF